MQIHPQSLRFHSQISYHRVLASRHRHQHYRTRDSDLQHRIIDSCISADVHRFITCEFGLDSRNPNIQQLLPPYASRARVIEHLQSTRLEWVSIATGLTLDRALLDGRLGVNLKWHSASFPGEGEVRIPVSSSQRIGEVLARVLEKWEELRNRYLLASGCVVSTKEVIDHLEREIDAKFEVSGINIEDLMREAERRLKGGWPDAGWGLIERCAIFDPEVRNAKAFVESDVNGVVELRAESAEEIVKETVHPWKHQDKGDCGCS